MFSKIPDVLPSARTICRHLREVEDKTNKCQNLIQEISGYSHEQLSNPPQSFRNEDELKLATEYHLWRAGWYLVRYITLHTAAESDGQVGEKYPSTYRCKTLASEAYQRFEYHNQRYLQCYKALSEIAQKDLMEEIKFPSHMTFQKFDDESNVISIVKTNLEHRIYCLLRKKVSMNSEGAKGPHFIRKMLTPSRSMLNSGMMSKLTTYFSVEDLSKPPNESSRSDRQFLEVAMLFNQYRSLWHEIRCNHFMKFIQRGKQGQTGVIFERAEEALKLESSAFERYALLSQNYQKMLNKYPPDKIPIFQNTPLVSDFIASGHQGEPIPRGARRRKTTRKKVEHQTLNENAQSVFDEMDHSQMVATKLDGLTKEKGAHRAKRYKCFEKPRKPSNDGQDQSNFDLLTAHNQNPIDPVLEARSGQPQAGLVGERMAMDRPAETCFQNNDMTRKRPYFDLNLPPPEINIGISSS